MKALFLGAGWAAVALGLALAGCFEPAERRTGTWLSGDVVTEPMSDWSFVNEHREILIETPTWYGIPHSLTILCASSGGRFFVGARNPTEKRWVANVGRNPEVRVKIDGRLYPVRLSTLEGDTERTAVRAAYAAKYDWPATPGPDEPPVRYFELVSRRLSRP